MRLLFYILCQCTCFAQVPSGPLLEPYTDEQRLKGFFAHRRQAEEFEKERLRGIDEIKKERQDWDLMMAKTIKSYKLEKAKEVQPLDDTGLDHKKDLAEKEALDLELEKARLRYVAERDLALKKKNAHVKLTEAEEYGLDQKWIPVDPKNRALYTGKNKYSIGVQTSSAGSSVPSGSYDSSPPPPPPPSVGPPQEFYEPEIPPPPPPSFPEGGGFDEIPPPIFDEPEF